MSISMRESLGMNQLKGGQASFFPASLGLFCWCRLDVLADEPGVAAILGDVAEEKRRHMKTVEESIELDLAEEIVQLCLSYLGEDWLTAKVGVLHNL